jgi:hypothetical protein
VAGFLHPLSGLDHIVAMVAVGLWGAILGAPALWLLPVVFPMVMAFGGALGVLGVPVPAVEAGIALSGIVLGLMVACSVRPPLWVASLLVACFAIFHGYAHGTELPDSANPLTFASGCTSTSCPNPLMAPPACAVCSDPAYTLDSGCTLKTCVNPRLNPLATYFGSASLPACSACLDQRSVLLLRQMQVDRFDRQPIPDTAYVPIVCVTTVCSSVIADCDVSPFDESPIAQCRRVVLPVAIRGTVPIAGDTLCHRRDGPYPLGLALQKCQDT